ncbi:hypothetical protein [Amycolatopsis sp. MJM2582]|uniref:hypothetical protein n=1 Tax=Amycolatopsis sp. MJM2582 TaxID=1427749 RepID=UPI0009DDA14B|nr:hypothetical protein [Amycolatopsis sp. MJM2582]
MNKRGRWAEHPELLQQRSRHGVIKATTLESLDMSSKVIYRRCLPGGPWQRLLPGIILLHQAPPTIEERVIGALLHAGPRALVTGVEACRRHGLRPRELPPDKDIHVLIPHEHKVRSAEFVTVERTHRLPEARTHEGVPLAPLVRATTDACRRLRTVEPIGRLLVEAIQRGRCSPEALAHELNKGSKRGTAIPRRILGEWKDLYSVAEARAKILSRSLLVQPSHWNPEICDSRGGYIGRPDAWWDDIALAWEIDSFDFHFHREDYRRTVMRNTRYAAAGIVVVQTLPSRLLTDPAGVLAELEAARLAAAARPRPPVGLTSRAA